MNFIQSSEIYGTINTEVSINEINNVSINERRRRRRHRNRTSKNEKLQYELEVFKCNLEAIELEQRSLNQLNHLQFDFD